MLIFTFHSRNVFLVLSVALNKQAYFSQSSPTEKWAMHLAILPRSVQNLNSIFGGN